MDKRKAIGRTAAELHEIFRIVPEAGLCFDLAHARQVDPSMTESYLILTQHKQRIRQVHISEVGTGSTHTRISYAAMMDFREVAWSMPSVPVILEAPVRPDEIKVELARVLDIFSDAEPARAAWSRMAG
jgi:hypothetical protein